MLTFAISQKNDKPAPETPEKVESAEGEKKVIYYLLNKKSVKLISTWGAHWTQTSITIIYSKN